MRRQSILVVELVVLSTFLLGIVSTANAVSYIVGAPPSDFLTIQAALDSPGVLNMDIITVKGDPITPIVYSGAGFYNVDFNGKNVKVQTGDSTGLIPMPRTCIIDCQGLGRAFIFQSGETVPFAELNGFIIVDGNATDASGYGGAIYCKNSSPRIKNCVITNCTADAGGGIACENSSPRLTNCIFIANSAQVGGGVMVDSGNPILTNCTFAGNSAQEGGGMLNLSTAPILTNCILWGDEPEEIRGNANVNYSCIEGGLPGLGNIDTDPCFAIPGCWDVNGTPEDANDDFLVVGDYHLKSQAGRWAANSQSWVQDNVTSPCIDAGNPDSPTGNEPLPNGNRINMGSYGGTAEASKTPIQRADVAGYIEAWGYNYQGDSNVPAGNDFVDIAVGGWGSHGLAIKSDGSLVAWGVGDCNVPDGNNFVTIAAGGLHSLALRADGSLAAWGNNDYGQCNVPPGTDFVSTAAGHYHSLAVKADGSLVAWGSNTPQGYDVLGVPAGSDFVAVATHDFYSVAIKADGSLAAWGSSSYDRLNVPEGNNFVDIALGYGHGLALKSDGSVVAWGRNWLGAGDVPEGNDFVDIGAGYDHSLALKSDGSLLAWGRNEDGQCDVPSGHNFVAISAGYLGTSSVALAEPLIAGYIDWTDLLLFVDRWLESGCSDANDWCGRADINRNTVVDSTDYSWLAKYWASIAPEPNAAGHPEPGDTATEVSITADLSWAGGVDTAAHGVYFGTNPTPDANEFQGYQTAKIFNPGIMTAATTYYWQVDEVGLGGETSGDVWSFTTSPVPGKAYNPNPSDLATNVNINHNLSWTANFYTTSHDVYFGTNPTPGAGEFEGNQTSTTFEPGTLDYETTYYWRIDGVGPGGTTTGVIWSFTTEAPPVPGQAGNPSPANMATDVNITICLNWEAGLNTESHDVYFGPNPIPDINDFQGNQTTTTFCPPNDLEYDTTYYWRIDEKNPYNTTTGDVWSFTTMHDPNLAGWWKFDETSGVIAYDSSGNGRHGQLVDGIGNGLVWAPGEGALNFDGSNNLSRVVVSTVGMSTTAGTIAIWANLAEPQNRGDGRNGSGYFFGCDNGVKDRILLYMDNSNTQLDVRIGDHSETNIITLGTLVWYHIALTWDSGGYVVHLNGAEIAAGTYSGLTTLPSTADIGNNGGSSKQSFHGLMGDVQVYDKSISTAEVQQLYQDVAD